MAEGRLSKPSPNPLSPARRLKLKVLVEIGEKVVYREKAVLSSVPTMSCSYLCELLVLVHLLTTQGRYLTQTTPEIVT